MRILVTNDDGIDSPYLAYLAQAALELGEVMVVAPMKQCSAMSQKITLDRRIVLERVRDYPVMGAEAFRIDGSPADCVRIVCRGAFGAQKIPDLVLSGVNDGANCGYDTLYSATVGAAMEAAIWPVPAICFSQKRGESDAVMKEQLAPILRELAGKDPGRGKVWNVNFPACPAESCRGIQYDRKPAQSLLYHDRYHMEEKKEDVYDVILEAEEYTHAEEGSDIRALLDGYISVGLLQNRAML